MCLLHAPTRVIPPMRVGMFCAREQMIFPMTPRNAPVVKNHRRPKMSLTRPTRAPIQQCCCQPAKSESGMRLDSKARLTPHTEHKSVNNGDPGNIGIRAANLSVDFSQIRSSHGKDSNRAHESECLSLRGVFDQKGLDTS